MYPRILSKSRAISVLACVTAAVAVSGCGEAIEDIDTLDDPQAGTGAQATSDDDPQTGTGEPATPDNVQQIPNFECDRICTATATCNKYCEMNTVPSTCRDYGYCIEPPTPTFCDRFNGRTVSIKTHHGTYVHPKKVGEDPTYGYSYRMNQRNWMSYDDTKFMVACNAAGGVTFRQNVEIYARTYGYKYIAMKPNITTSDVYALGNELGGNTQLMTWTPMSVLGNWVFKGPQGGYLRAPSAAGGWLNLAATPDVWERFDVVIR